MQGYELSAEEKAALKKQLESCSRKLVESLVREASHTVLSRMKDRCTSRAIANCEKYASCSSFQECPDHLDKQAVYSQSTECARIEAIASWWR